MKHTSLVTFFLVAIFLVTQIVGLTLIKSISQNVVVDEEGNRVIVPEASLESFTPQTEGAGSLLYIVIAIGVGTIILLLIAKFNKVNIWKAWFFLAVAIATGISLQVILKDVLSPALMFIPWSLGVLLAGAKLFWKNVIMYNIAEVLMYTGIALILAPILNIFWAFVLLVLIAIYDMYAVWKSKHMVTMAKFQQGTNVFAGLMIPYTRKEGKKTTAVESKSAGKSVPKPDEPKIAILGGGDVAFPLIFEGVVLRDMIVNGVPPEMALLYSLVIVATTTIALALLFVLAKKDRFYPAMPFISAGCFVGFLLLLAF
ncbi:MAG: presenilin family intramembrane aspartyl protease [Nanoarchaeota archaeon]